MVLKIPRKQYVELFGPTKGDRIRLGDTDLIIEIEKDLITYGDELVFGGGKSIRDGMGQASGIKSKYSLDLVITNTILMDPLLGIVKTDIGIKNGLILGIGKAGNLDVHVWHSGTLEELLQVGVGPTLMRAHHCHVVQQDGDRGIGFGNLAQGRQMLRSTSDAGNEVALRGDAHKS